MIKSFLYNFWFLDSKTKEISTAKFWQNVASLLLCIAFVADIFKAVQLNVDLLMVFAGAFIIHRGIEKYLNRNINGNNTHSPKENIPNNHS